MTVSTLSYDCINFIKDWLYSVRENYANFILTLSPPVTIVVIETCLGIGIIMTKKQSIFSVKPYSF